MNSKLFMVAMAVLAGTATQAHAAIITYTAVATVSGSLGPTLFTSAVATIEFTSDTATAHIKTGVPDLWINTGTGTITITGAGTATFMAGPLVFSEQGGPTHDCSSVIGCFAGIGAGTPVGPTLLGVINASFFSYDLTSAIGPVTGPSVSNASLSVPTSVGPLQFTSVDNASFTATTAAPTAVPEPARLSFMGIALIALIGLTRLRSSQFPPTPKGLSSLNRF